MDLLTHSLGELHAQVSAVLSGSIADRSFQRATEQELATQLEALGGVQRLVEALLVEATGETIRRSESPIRDERMTSHLGCRNVTELLEQTTRVSALTAGRWQRAAKAVRPTVGALSGELLDAAFPSVRAAAVEGVIGVDGILAIVGPLQESAPRVSAPSLREAAHVVVAEARGEGPDGAPPACADLLRLHAQTWALALDQDGAEPRDRAAERKRSLILGTAGAGGVPVRGTLLPEVAAQLQTIFDAHLSPAVAFGDPLLSPDHDLADDRAPRDERTRYQKQHDALAAALGVAASSGLLPTIGGHAPTLVISVDADDLANDTGHAHAHGSDQPVSVAAARHLACAGVIQRVVICAGGRIIALGTEERVFNRHQRRAIALRDGGCVIPGCGVPAGWCEIHHVTEYARGGSTHTDNGVLLCWYHHRFLDRAKRLLTV